MKLLYFTPGIRESAIGRMAKIVVQQLVATGHQTTVVRSESLELMPLETHIFQCPVISWNEQKAILKAAKDVDAVIYQIGDNFQLHKGCLEWLPNLPGIICLHDYFLGNLFWGWAGYRPRADAYAVLKRFYGSNVEGYFHYANTESFIEATHSEMPMTEWMASMAEAVAVHSSWGINRVLSVCPGPVKVIPLAYNKPQIDPKSLDESKSDNFVVLTIGHINPNKRVKSVIRAIGASDHLRERTIFRLVGQIESNVTIELTSLSQDLGVNLKILGKVDDHSLARAILQADVVSCLRWPTLEAASASAIETMLCAKPVIVTDSGFYSELPDDCVIKISQEHELVELRRALEELNNNSELRMQLGQRAEAYASVTFSAEQYAKSLIDLIDEAKSQSVFKEALTSTIETLHGWGANRDVAYSLINTEALGLFNVPAEKFMATQDSSKAFWNSKGFKVQKNFINCLYDFFVSRPKLFNLILSILRYSPRVKNYAKQFWVILSKRL